MRKLLKYLNDYKKESVIGPLFKLLEACFELVVPLIMANMIDIGIRNQDTGYILRMGSILILFAVLGLACSLTAQYFAAKASVGFGTALRHDMFRHIQSLSYAEIDRAGSATLVTRITSDINQVQSGVNLVLRLFLRSPFIVVGALIMAFTISVKLALIFVVAVPLLALVIYGSWWYRFRFTGRYRNCLTGFYFLQEKIWKESASSGLLACREENGMNSRRRMQNFWQHRCWSEKFRLFKSGNLHYRQRGDHSHCLVWRPGNIRGWHYTGRGHRPCKLHDTDSHCAGGVVQSDCQLYKSACLCNRINEVFALEPSIQDGDGVKKVTDKEGAEQEQTREAAAFHQVSFAYPESKVYAVTGLDFSVKKGEMIGVIGGTGSGKSTLVQMIPRFYDVAEGSVTVDGEDVRNYKIEELRKKIGMVPQRAVLFRGTIRDNMKVGNEDADDEQIMEAIRTAQALEVVEGKPDGLDTLINEGGKNLSGGQKQRLTIARALVRKPQILILDDSASALDFATDARLRKAVKGLKDMTVFVVSQRAASVMQADRIIVMDDGKIAGIGTHDELMKSCEVYREICLSQLSEKEVGQHA